MRCVFVFIFLALSTVSSFGDNYFNKPLYTDMNLSQIALSVEKEIESLLKENPDSRNVILNYLKTIEFTKGKVSTVQFRQYDAVLSGLDETLRSKIRKITDDFLSSKNYKITVIEINGSEYYLPIKIIEPGK